ncbi:MAG TPA: crossover junction endodeoxyribonuclease RuvC [Armatimonadota bacterium]|jgi:crossover junction endodeoxyribonuclease RuvC
MATARVPSSPASRHSTPALFLREGPLRFLGIDPGLGTTGYGVVDRGPTGLRLIEAGALRSHRTDCLEERVRTIFAGVTDVLEEFKPACMALEDLYSEYAYPKTALLMAHVRGAVCLAAAQHEVPVVGYAASEVKNAIVGMGNASKEQVQGSIQNLFGLAAPPTPNDVADAIALAVTAAYRLCGPGVAQVRRVR